VLESLTVVQSAPFALEPPPSGEPEVPPEVPPDVPPDVPPEVPPDVPPLVPCPTVPLDVPELPLEVPPPVVVSLLHAATMSAIPLARTAKMATGKLLLASMSGTSTDQTNGRAPLHALQRRYILI
jgi:hypothetical protein